jgi:transposase
LAWSNICAATDGPSIDPEVVLHLLLVGYFHGLTSEHGLLEELRMHLAYPWFTRLVLGKEITLSKNWHEHIRRSDMFREVFE